MYMWVSAFIFKGGVFRLQVILPSARSGPHPMPTSVLIEPTIGQR